MGATRTFLVATGIGSSLMYLLDPATGRRRRAIARDKIVHAGRKAGTVAGKTARDLRNRTQGLVARTRSRLTYGREVPDDVLHDQIRSRLGRVVSHPSAIEVSVWDGRVTLSGPILAGEVEPLLGELSSMRGIRDLEDDLEVHDEPGTIPSLQGVGSPRRLRSWKRDTWPPALRLSAGSAGLALLLASMRRESPQPERSASRRRVAEREAVGVGLHGTDWSLGRWVLGGAGAALLLRSTFNLPWKRIVGVGAGRTAVDVRKSIYVDAPVDRVFDFWSNFENLPKFLTNVKEVRRTEKPNEYHWTVAGPAGVPVEWYAELTRLVPNQMVGWKTVSDSVVKNAGMVEFRPEDGGTRVDVHLKYNPGIGALGHAAAKLFGSDPKTLMDQDLLRMKTYLETGSSPQDSSV